MKKTNDKTGMTLLEILVVVAILGLLATIIAISLNDYRIESRLSKATSDLTNARKAIDLLGSDTGYWPLGEDVGYVCSAGGCSDNELWDLRSGEAGIVANDGTFSSDDWNGPYIKNISEDPWGNLYFYDSDYDTDTSAGESWATVIGSFGPDAKDATEQELQDDHQNQYGSIAEDNVIIILAE